MYNIDSFIIDEDENIYNINSYDYSEVKFYHSFCLLRANMVIINTIDVDFKEYIKNNFFQNKYVVHSLTIKLYMNDIIAEVFASSMLINKIEGNIIKLHFNKITPIIS